MTIVSQRKGRLTERILEIRGVSRSFGGLRALQDLTVSLTEGETVGLVGPNGAGKTTLFNIICGMKPASGEISFKGKDITGLKPNEICHKGIARTFQLTRPFTNLSVLDNVSCALLFGRKRKGITGLSEAREIAAGILNQVELAHRVNTPAKELLFADRRRMEKVRK